MQYNKKIYALIIIITITITITLFISNIEAIINLNEFICMCKLSKFSAVQSDILLNMLEKDRIQDRKATPWLRKLYHIINNQKCIPISPLSCAIQYGADKSLIVVLLKEFKLRNLKLDNIYDDNGYSMLSVAIRNNDIQLVKLLLKYDYPLIWDRNTFLATSALHMAAEYDYIDIIDYLLPYTNKELNLHSNNISGITPLYYIIRNNREKYAISLLKKFPPKYSVAYLGKNSYLSIAKKQKMELLTYFLECILLLDDN